MLIICLHKRKRDHTDGDKRTAGVSGDPKGSQKEVGVGGGVRDRVTNIGEERRGEMGLSDF